MANSEDRGDAALITRYLAYVRVERRLAERTVAIYADDDCDGTATTVSTLILPPADTLPAPVHSDNPSTTRPFESYRLRLVDLTRDVLAGTTVSLTFRFQRAPAVTLEVPVRPRQDQASSGHLCGSPPAASPNI